MVLMNAGRAARHYGATVNKANCGGPKKAGLSGSVGKFMSMTRGRLPRGVNTQIGLICIPNKSHQTHTYGYRATIGGNL